MDKKKIKNGKKLNPDGRSLWLATEKPASIKKKDPPEKTISREGTSQRGGEQIAAASNLGRRTSRESINLREKWVNGGNQ